MENYFEIQSDKKQNSDPTLDLGGIPINYEEKESTAEIKKKRFKFDSLPHNEPNEDSLESIVVKYKEDSDSNEKYDQLLKIFTKLRNNKRGLNPIYADTKLSLLIYELESKFDELFREFDLNEGEGSDEFSKIKGHIDEFIKKMKKKISQYRYYFHGTEEYKENLIYLKEDLTYLYQNFKSKTKLNKSELLHWKITKLYESFNKQRKIFKKNINEAFKNSLSNPSGEFSQIILKLNEEFKQIHGNSKEVLNKLNSLINVFQADFFESFSKRLNNIMEDYSEYNLEKPKDEQKAFGGYASLIMTDDKNTPSIIYLSDLNTLVLLKFSLKESNENNKNQSLYELPSKKKMKSKGSKPTYLKTDKHKGDQSIEEEGDSTQTSMQLKEIANSEKNIEVIDVIGISKGVTKMAVSPTGNLIVLTTNSEEKLFNVYWRDLESDSKAVYKYTEFSSGRATNAILIAPNVNRKNILIQLSDQAIKHSSSSTIMNTKNAGKFVKINISKEGQPPSDTDNMKKASAKETKGNDAGVEMRNNTGNVKAKASDTQKADPEEIVDLKVKSADDDCPLTVIFEVGDDLIINVYTYVNKIKEEVKYSRFLNIESGKLPAGARGLHSILYDKEKNQLYVGSDKGILINVKIKYFSNDYEISSNSIVSMGSIRLMTFVIINQEKYIIASDYQKLARFNLKTYEHSIIKTNINEICQLRGFNNYILIGNNSDNKLQIRLIRTEVLNEKELNSDESNYVQVLEVDGFHSIIDVFIDDNSKPEQETLNLLLYSENKNFRIFSVTINKKDLIIPASKPKLTESLLVELSNNDKTFDLSRSDIRSISLENSTCIFHHQDNKLKYLKIIDEEKTEIKWYKIKFQMSEFEKKEQLLNFFLYFDRGDPDLLPNEINRIISSLTLWHSPSCKNYECYELSKSLLDFNFSTSDDEQRKKFYYLVEDSNRKVKNDLFCSDIKELINKLDSLFFIDEHDNSESKDQVKSMFLKVDNILLEFRKSHSKKLKMTLKNLALNIEKSDKDINREIANIQNIVNFDVFYDIVFNKDIFDFKIFLNKERVFVLTSDLILFVFKDLNVYIPPKINILTSIKGFRGKGEMDLGFLNNDYFFVTNSYNGETSVHFLKDNDEEHQKNSPEPRSFPSELSVLAYKSNLLVLGLYNHELVLITFNSAITEKKLYPHCAKITCLAISNDRKSIASGSEDESFKVFDALTGEPKNTVRYKSGDVIGLVFLSNDLFIAASYQLIHANGLYEYKLYIFSLESEECMINIGFKSMIELRTAPFRYLFVRNDNEILINDADEDFSWIKKHIAKPRGMLQSQQLVNSIFLSKYTINKNEVQICAYGGESNEVEFLNSKVSSSQESFYDDIYCISLSKLDKNQCFKLAAGSKNGRLKVFKCRNNPDPEHPEQPASASEEIKMELQYQEVGLESSINSLSFSSDDTILICGLGNAEIIAYSVPLEDNANAKVTKLLVCKLHKKDVISDLKFSPIENKFELVSGGYDRRLILSTLMFSNDRINKIVKIKEFKKHKGAVYAVSWSDNGNRFLSGGEDKMIVVYDRESLSIIRIIRNHNGSVWNADFFTKDGSQVISSGEDKTVIISDTLTSLENHRFNIEIGSDIWDFVYNEDDDKVIVVNDQGLFELYPFKNTNMRMIHIRNVLQKKDVPVRLPDDLNALPHPFKMNRLQYSIGMNEINYIDDLLKYFKEKTDKEDREFNHIYSLLYNTDWNDSDAWDYSITYAADNRNRIQRTLIDLHLMMGKQCYRYLHLVKNNVKIIEITKKFFSEKLLDVFETFFTTPMYIPIMKDLIKRDTHFMSSPYPNNEIINNLLNPKKQHNILELNTNPNPYTKTSNNSSSKIKSEEIRRIYASELLDSAGDKHYKQETIEAMVKTFQVVYKDIPQFLKVINGLEVEDEIFGSENLLKVVNFYWETKYRFWFFISLGNYIVFLVLVCLLILKSFVTRFDECKEICSNSLLTEALIYKILVLALLAFFIIREILQFFYQKIKTLRGKLIYHFSSMWNIIDIIMISTGLASVIIDLIAGPGIESPADISTDVLKYIYSIFLFFSWMRLLEFARGFEMLSFLVRLLAKVSADMFGFLVVLFYMIIGFGLMSFVLQKSYLEHSFTEYIRIFYLVLLGNYDTFLNIEPDTHLNKDYSFFIIVAVSLIMVILMLNMLIALISESHERVMDLEKQANIYEKLDLINGMASVDKALRYIKALKGGNEHPRDSDENAMKYCSFLILKDKNTSTNDRSHEKIDSMILKLDSHGKKIEQLVGNSAKSTSKSETKKQTSQKLTSISTLIFDKMIKHENKALTPNRSVKPLPESKSEPFLLPNDKSIPTIVQEQERRIETLMNNFQNLENLIKSK